MNLSKKVLSVSPSLTLAITAKAKQMKAGGIDVVSLSAGEPDFDTPEPIKQAAITSLQKGYTKYTPASGGLDLREAICRKFKRDQGLTYPADQIIVSVGAKHALFNVLYSLINEGDEVLIMAPYWLSYPEMVTLAGGKSVILQTSEAQEFKVTVDQLKKAITSKTKALILNSPSNPTGAVYTKEELTRMAEFLKNYPDVTVISDEIYEKLVFDRVSHFSIAQVGEEMAAKTVIINGHSKAYAMTGWRLGYTACPNKELAKAIGNLQSHSTSNPTSFAQAGGIVALDEGEEEASKMREVFQKRRNFFFEKIKKIPFFKPYRARGAFYLFVNIEKTGLSSIPFAERLLEEAHVAVVPGAPFGADGYVRMSFASSEGQLKKAAERLAKWCESLA